MLVHDFATALAHREYYYSGAASILPLIMRKRPLERREAQAGISFVMLKKVPCLCCLFPSIPYCCRRRLLEEVRLRLVLAIIYSAIIDRLIWQAEYVSLMAFFASSHSN